MIELRRLPPNPSLPQVILLRNQFNQLKELTLAKANKNKLKELALAEELQKLEEEVKKQSSNRVVAKGVEPFTALSQLNTDSGNTRDEGCQVLKSNIKLSSFKFL